MWVKICANTNLEDAKLAVELGADALGFVFAAASSRRVTPQQVAPIVQELPESIEKVGIFAELDLAAIRAAVEYAGLTAVQLHGEYTPELILGLRKERSQAGECGRGHPDSASVGRGCGQRRGECTGEEGS
ncbi:hypothetical protein AB4043_01395 [Terriglobus sp. YAF25]|uniref:phosphoribosylanthranilate isomerase n=1 Tax=Terriglobus sp. YAF25 TaxID=3233080 RepID=UPI003F9A9FFA